MREEAGEGAGAVFLKYTPLSVASVGVQHECDVTETQNKYKTCEFNFITEGHSAQKHPQHRVNLRT